MLSKPWLGWSSFSQTTQPYSLNQVQHSSKTPDGVTEGGSRVISRKNTPRKTWPAKSWDVCYQCCLLPIRQYDCFYYTQSGHRWLQWELLAPLLPWGSVPPVIPPVTEPRPTLQVERIRPPSPNLWTRNWTCTTMWRSLCGSLSQTGWV